MTYIESGSKPSELDGDQRPIEPSAIAIPLHGFEYIHDSRDHHDDQAHLIVGRKNIIKKLADLLVNVNGRGSFLIAGYRGSGKTQTVNRALCEHQRSHNNNLLVVRINLGDNSQLTPLNIYYSICNILRDEITNTGNGECNDKSKSKIFKSKFKNFFRPTIDLRNIGILVSLSLAWTIPIFLVYPEIFSVIDAAIYKWLIILTLPSTILIWLISLRLYPEFKSINYIDRLIDRMSNEISEEQSAAFKHTFNIGLSKHKKNLPINAREAEELLITILRVIKNSKRKVVFVLDEIDKLSDNEELSEIHHHDKTHSQDTDKNSKINTLLGSLKNFITTAPATFFFISGRETLDRYYSEKGSPNSLYGSLFDQVFEIPSLLSDKGKRPERNTQLYAGIEEYVCRRIRIKGDDTSSYYTLECYRKSFANSDEKETRYGLAVLMNFIFYLTFHSWGNPKKLSSIFESFIYPKQLVQESSEKSIRFILQDKQTKPEHWLVFNANHLRSFSLASEITTLFQHHLSREVSQISDKLTVSSFSSLHFILKLHSYGFKRESLHLMSEAINVYRSPELNSIVDDLLTNIFKSYIRRVRNGLYRYRFNSGFEQELRYISHVSGLESASFNFSLDSMRYVKRFFEVVLANTNILETDVISRSHISLGDMCTIEQSYNAASIHYHTASRILSSALKKEETIINQETLMQCIEVLLKHGDLEERRQNYNHAAAIYNEAERIIQSLSSDRELSLNLQSGDSKWDLLKLPFWASRYLDLKRSPRPYKKYMAHVSKKIQPPEYLYRSNDLRFHYRAASLYFFFGEAESAIESYKATLGHAGYDPNSNIPGTDERNAYMIGNALVGIIESTLTQKSRELFNIIYELEIYKKEIKEKFLIIEKEKLSLIKKKFLNKLFEFIRNPHELAMTPLEEPRSIDELLDEAVDIFEKNRLYISAAMTHIKAIHYNASLLDLFDNNIFVTDLQNAFGPIEAELPNEVRKIYIDIELKQLHKKINQKILDRANEAINCINKARQLESNQSNKTLLAYNVLSGSPDSNSIQITTLFDSLLSSNKTNYGHLNEGIYWQHSLWAHKLASSLFWTDYVLNKVSETNYHNFNNAIPLPRELSMLSVRATIVMRWTQARNLCRKYVDKKLMINDSLTIDGESLINYILCNNDKIEAQNKKSRMVLEKTCEASRHLYLAQESSRIISRKNLDLIFPRSPQIYLAQWKLLSNFIRAILVARCENKIPNANVPLNSIRDISFLLQKVLLDIDIKLAPSEKIPPSHFDYEHIYIRLMESLESSISLIDRNSRTHMGIFEYKYFCHDDHNDPEFRMDYTLAYMFTPIAMYWLNEVKEAHDKLLELLNKINTPNPQV